MRTPVPLNDLETPELKGRSWLGWQTLVWTGLLVLLLYSIGIGNHTLWGYHEPYVGGIIREMVSSGDYIVPTLNGQPYLEKPPLFYAMGAAVCKVFGTFEPWALRLPSALMAVATSVWIGFMAWRLGSARAAGWAGFTLATSALFFEMGHTAAVDMTLTATVTFGLGLAYLVIVEPSCRQHWSPLFWVALGLAFMAKGVIGPLLVITPLGFTLLLHRDTRLLRSFLSLNWGMAMAVVLVAGWVALLWYRGGTLFLSEVFLRNTVGRFTQDPNLVPMTGRLSEHVEPWYFYLLRTPVNVLPWFAVWIAALWSAIPRHRGRHLSPRTYFLPLAFVLNLVILSLSKAKREVYMLPLLPLTFLHAALWLDTHIPRARQRMDVRLLAVIAVTLGLVGLMAVGFPWVLVKEFSFSKGYAAAISAVSLPLSVWSARQLWRKNYHGAFGVTMVHWTLCLSLFLAYGVPSMDRQQWKPLVDPYLRALAMRDAGAELVGAGLTETHMGYASLTFQQMLPTVDRPDQLRALLNRPMPVAVLVEPHWWERAQADGMKGTVVATAASILQPNRRERTPMLVINAAMAARLSTARLAVP